MQTCTRCRRAEAVEGKRSCRGCRDRDRNKMTSGSAACEQQSLYAMRTLDGHLKVGRSSDVHRRCRELSATGVLREWPRLGRLEPLVHRLLEEFQVSREVFDCPLEAVEAVVTHARSMGAYIK